MVALSKTLRYQSAGGVVVDDAGRVLLIERHIEGHHEVRLPKGHIEANEPADAAALREVCEETGYCDLEILADLGWRQVTFNREETQVVRKERYFLMALASAIRQAPNFSTAREALFRNRWVDGFAMAEEALTFEAEQDAVRRAHEAYLQHIHSLARNALGHDR